MSELLEDRIREELVGAAGAVVPPSELVSEVRRRLRRRHRRLAVTAGTVAVGAAVAIVAVVLPGTTTHPHPSSPPPDSSIPPPPRPAVDSPEVVHGPALIDTRSGQALRAIRTVVLPGGRSPIKGMTDGDTFYAVATLSNGVDLGNFQRLVRVSSTGQTAIAHVAMRAPTAPVMADGQVWVADRHRVVGFDPTTLATDRIVRLPNDLPGQVAAAGGYVWVAAWTHLDRINPATGSLLRIAPDSGTQRYAGVATSPSGQLITASSHLPDTTENVGSIAVRNPMTGAIVSSQGGLSIGAGDIGGVAGGALWLRDVLLDTSPKVAEVSPSTLAVTTPLSLGASSGDSVHVTVSNGLPWVSASTLRDTSGHGAVMECLSPATGAPVGEISLKRYPGVPTSALPAKTTTPAFFAAGPNEMYMTVGQDVVIYPRDPSCTT